METRIVSSPNTLWKLFYEVSLAHGMFVASWKLTTYEVSCVRWHIVFAHISNTEHSFHYVYLICITETITPLQNAICITYTQFLVEFL